MNRYSFLPLGKYRTHRQEMLERRAGSEATETQTFLPHDYHPGRRAIISSRLTIGVYLIGAILLVGSSLGLIAYFFQTLQSRTCILGNESKRNTLRDDKRDANRTSRSVLRCADYLQIAEVPSCGLP